jgi:polysaccharide biosynthesis protein PslJ
VSLPQSERATAPTAIPAVPRGSGRTEGPRGRLPAWPLAWLFVGLPLWWVLGLIDVIVVPAAVVMLLYLGRAGHVRVPRGFSVWMLFVAFMGGSVIELTKFTDYLMFGYRAAIYLASTVVFVYVYNSWRSISDRRVQGYLVGYFVFMVAGGFLGAAFPVHKLTTPMYYALDRFAPLLVSNDLVRVMVIRPLSQYDPTNYFQVPPRPAAPFIYTNNWGEAYSLLLPLVLVFLLETRRHTWQRRLLVLLALASAVPAMLTLNRGMFIGLGIAAVYVGLRLAARGYLLRVVLAGSVAGGIAWFLWNALHVSAGLETRVQASNDTRTSLYTQALHAITGSPFFGFGVTIHSTSTNPWDPKVGTQGQFWMVLISHGVIAVTCFVGFFLLAALLTFRRRDLDGMAYNAVVFVGAVETLYYGMVPYGLPLLMTIAALAFRPSPSERRRLLASRPENPPQEASAAEA